jgi:hypothetical protein
MKQDTLFGVLLVHLNTSYASLPPQRLSAGAVLHKCGTKLADASDIDGFTTPRCIPKPGPHAGHARLSAGAVLHKCGTKLVDASDIDGFITPRCVPKPGPHKGQARLSAGAVLHVCCGTKLTDASDNDGFTTPHYVPKPWSHEDHVRQSAGAIPHVWCGTKYADSDMAQDMWFEVLLVHSNTSYALLSIQRLSAGAAQYTCYGTIEADMQVTRALILHTRDIDGLRFSTPYHASGMDGTSLTTPRYVPEPRPHEGHARLSAGAAPYTCYWAKFVVRLTQDVFLDVLLVRRDTFYVFILLFQQRLSAGAVLSLCHETIYADALDVEDFSIGTLYHASGVDGVSIRTPRQDLENWSLEDRMRLSAGAVSYIRVGTKFVVQGSVLYVLLGVLLVHPLATHALPSEGGRDFISLPAHTRLSAGAARYTCCWAKYVDDGLGLYALLGVLLVHPLATYALPSEGERDFISLPAHERLSAGAALYTCYRAKFAVDSLVLYALLGVLLAHPLVTYALPSKGERDFISPPAHERLSAGAVPYACFGAKFVVYSLVLYALLGVPRVHPRATYALPSKGGRYFISLPAHARLSAGAALYTCYWAKSVEDGLDWYVFAGVLLVHSLATYALQTTTSEEKMDIIPAPARARLSAGAAPYACFGAKFVVRSWVLYALLGVLLVHPLATDALPSEGERVFISLPAHMHLHVDGSDPAHAYASLLPEKSVERFQNNAQTVVDTPAAMKTRDRYVPDVLVPARLFDEALSAASLKMPPRYSGNPARWRLEWRLIQLLLRLTFVTGNCSIRFDASSIGPTTPYVNSEVDGFRLTMPGCASDVDGLSLTTPFCAPDTNGLELILPRYVSKLVSLEGHARPSAGAAPYTCYGAKFADDGMTQVTSFEVLLVHSSTSCVTLSHSRHSAGAVPYACDGHKLAQYRNLAQDVPLGVLLVRPGSPYALLTMQMFDTTILQGSVAPRLRNAEPAKPMATSPWQELSQAPPNALEQEVKYASPRLARKLGDDDDCDGVDMTTNSYARHATTHHPHAYTQHEHSTHMCTACAVRFGTDATKFSHTPSAIPTTYDDDGRKGEDDDDHNTHTMMTDHKDMHVHLALCRIRLDRFTFAKDPTRFPSFNVGCYVYAYAYTPADMDIAAKYQHHRQGRAQRHPSTPFTQSVPCSGSGGSRRLIVYVFMLVVEMNFDGAPNSGEQCRSYVFHALHHCRRISTLHLRETIRLASVQMLDVTAHLRAQMFTSQVQNPKPSQSTHTTHERSSLTASTSSRSRCVYSTKSCCAVVRLRRNGGSSHQTKRPEVAPTTGEHTIPLPGLTSSLCLFKVGKFDVTLRNVLQVRSSLEAALCLRLPCAFVLCLERRCSVPLPFNSTRLLFKSRGDNIVVVRSDASRPTSGRQHTQKGSERSSSAWCTSLVRRVYKTELIVRSLFLCYCLYVCRLLLDESHLRQHVPEFTNSRLSCTHQPSEHAPCAGVDTKTSEGYTDALATSIHACFALHVCSLGLGETASPEDVLDEYVVDY